MIELLLAKIDGWKTHPNHVLETSGAGSSVVLEFSTRRLRRTLTLPRRRLPMLSASL